MPLTLDNASALVPGSGRGPGAKPRKIRVTAPFRYEGQTLRPGAVIETHWTFAAEMVLGRRAVYVVDEPPPPPPVQHSPERRASTRFKKGGVPPDAT